MAVSPTALGTAVSDPTTNKTSLVFTSGIILPNNYTAIGLAWTRDSTAGNTALVSGVTSIGGITWTVDGSHVGPSSGGVTAFSAKNLSGSDIASGLAVTAALTSNQHRTKMAIWIVPGICTWEQSVSTSGNSATLATGALPALTGTDDFVFAGIAHYPSGSDSAGAVSGWTELSDDTIGATSFLHSVAAWKLSGTAGATPSYSPVAGIASNYAAVLLAYKFATVSAPSNLSAPTLVGTAQVGQTLTSDGGTWNNGGDSGMTLAYQWQKFSGSAWVSATGAGATTLSYVIDPSDQGLTLRLQTTAVNSAAPSGVTATSTASGTVIPVGTQSPLADPVITSAQHDGQRSNSTSETFTWTAQAGVTWWTQLDNNAWENLGSATTKAYTNLHGATPHRFRLMAVLGGVASRIRTLQFDIVSPYNRIKFYTGTEAALVLPVQWTGHTLASNATDWQTQLNDINNYMSEASWGQFQFQFTLANALTISSPGSIPSTPNDPTFYNSLKTLADAAAVSAGYTLSNYLHIYYMTPDIGDGTIGFTDVLTGPSLTAIYRNVIPRGLDTSYVYGLNASTHELGHTLGFTHANALNCGSLVLDLTVLAAAEADSSGGSGNIEYGNTTSTMGRGENDGTRERPGHHTGFHKWQAGWSQGNKIKRVYDDGDYLLSPTEIAGATVPYCLTFNVGTRYYYVEFRTATGYDSHLNLQPNNLTGVLISLIDFTGVGAGSLDYAGTPSGRGPWLLDMTPNSQSTAVDADADTKDSALTTGRTFTDPAGLVTVTCKSIAGNLAVVTIAGLPDPPATSTEIPGLSDAGTVSLTPVTPQQNQVFVAQATMLAAVRAVSTTGAIVSGTVAIDNGTPFTLTFDSSLNAWKANVAIQQGANTAVFRVVDTAGNAGTLVVSFSNATSNPTSNPPAVDISNPDEGDVLSQSGILAQANVASDVQMGAVEVSVDKGASWAIMTQTSGGGGSG